MLLQSVVVIGGEQQFNRKIIKFILLLGVSLVHVDIVPLILGFRSTRAQSRSPSISVEDT
jgi:hypothetical protein